MRSRSSCCLHPLRCRTRVELSRTESASARARSSVTVRRLQTRQRACERAEEKVAQPTPGRPEFGFHQAGTAVQDAVALPIRDSNEPVWRPAVEYDAGL